MSTVPEIFIDGLGKTRFAGGVLRIDLVTLQDPPEGSAKAAATETRMKLVMTPQGLLQTVKGLNALVQEMVDRGILVAQKPKGDA